MPIFLFGGDSLIQSPCLDLIGMIILYGRMRATWHENTCGSTRRFQPSQGAAKSQADH